MSNIAVLCYSDAAHWWISDTPLQSSHTHSLSVWLHQLIRELARQRSDVKKKPDVSGALNICCIRIQQTRLYSDWLRNLVCVWGGFHDSAAALWHLKMCRPFFFITVGMLSPLLAADVIPFVSCLIMSRWWVFCQYHNRSWDSSHSICFMHMILFWLHICTRFVLSLADVVLDLESAAFTSTVFFFFNIY